MSKKLIIPNRIDLYWELNSMYQSTKTTITKEIWEKNPELSIKESHEEATAFMKNNYPEIKELLKALRE